MYAWSEVTLDLVFPVFLAWLFSSVYWWIFNPARAIPVPEKRKLSLSSRLGRGFRGTWQWVKSRGSNVSNHHFLSALCWWSAALYFVSDLTENILIALIFGFPGLLDALAFFAALAGTLKWTFVYVSTALIAIALIRVRPRQMLRLARHVFHARIAIILGFVVLLIGYLGRTRGCDDCIAPIVGMPTVQNMLSLDTVWQVMWATLAVYACSAVIVFSGVHVWRLAQVRFQTGRLGLDIEATQTKGTAGDKVIFDRSRSIFGIAAFAVSLPVLARLVHQGGAMYLLAGIGLGLVLGAVFLAVVYWIRQWVTGQSPGLVAHILRCPFERSFGFLHSPGWRGGVKGALGKGYLRPDGEHFYHGHALSVAVFIALFGVYLVLYVSLNPTNSIYSVFEVPPIAYVMLLIAFICAVPTKVTFVFDRTRIPVLLVVIAWIALWGSLPKSLVDTNYYFDAQPLDAGTPRPPGVVEAFDARAANGDKNRNIITVVSVTGGGIQAAGWGAAVLTGLAEEFGDEFNDSVYFMSSTSGGSVGVFYYIEALRGGSNLVTRAPNAAMASSLEATAWGMVFPDLKRWVLPLFLWTEVQTRIDRAWAIEQAWLRWLDCMRKVAPGDKGGFERNPKCRNRVSESITVNQPYMSDWWKAAAAGTLPGIVFNATVIEDGEQFLASNLDLRLFDLEHREKGAFTIDDNWTYGGFDPTLCEHYARDTSICNKNPELLDMKAVTAARLSAAFPYVTPAAQARLASSKASRWHIADGGYFDNSGAVAVVRWVETIRSRLDANAEVLYIQINPFPEAPEVDPNKKVKTGWAKGFIGPIEGLFNVRTSSQLARNDVELTLLERMLGERFEAIEFRPPYQKNRREAPLSWELSDDDKAKICDDWRENAGRVAYLREKYFGGKATGLSCAWQQ